MNRKAIVSAAISLAMCAGMSVTAYASNNPFAELEAISRQALDVAVSAGTVPEGTTIFDCTYTTGEDGITRVIRYRDKDGNVIDVTTGDVYAQQDKPASSADSLSEEALAEYADEVFRLTNAAREEAGLQPLERDAEVDEAALMRATEYASIKSIRVDGQPHTRLDGSKFSTILDEMDISWSGGASENSAEGHKTPEDVMNAWLDSDGHLANVLRENRTHIGIGICQASNGRLYWIQLFTTP